LDDDRGPNTGGMGAFSPVAELHDDALTALRTDVFLPVLRELERRGTPFRGALFAGLMLTADGPRVLEFNARFGDPETQAILPRLAEPLLPLLTGDLSGSPILAAKAEATVGITLAAAGSPDNPRRGDAVSGIAQAREMGALVFGAGVAGGVDGQPVTAGGRVLTVVGSGSDVAEAADAAYGAAEAITFDGRQIRRDIGRALARAVA
jgi:phosphoribosylamine--glycine ligase